MGAYYSDGARHQWISVEVKLVSHVECDARDYDVGIIIIVYVHIHYTHVNGGPLPTPQNLNKPCF